MLCFNGTSCPTESLCYLNFYVCPDRVTTDRPKQVSSIALALPIVEALHGDHLLSRYVYLIVFILLVTIGFISNILSLRTFIRDRIRLTVPGVYLLVFTICSILLLIAIVLTVLSVFHADHYFSHIWTCHGYPYVTLVMVYTSMLASAALAYENVLNRYFGYDKYRTRWYAVLVVFLSFTVTSVINLDKIIARRLRMNSSGDFYCTYDTASHMFWFNLQTVFFDILVLLVLLVHWTCFLRIYTMKVKENYIQRLFLYRHYWVPSLMITCCSLLYSIYRNFIQTHFLHSSPATIRLHLGFLLLLYAPQICTYWIYIVANDFHVREFYQIWFHRKLCCCLYNRKRHIQEFEVIHLLWQRRTSLETIKTISTLNDTYVQSEFYRKL